MLKARTRIPQFLAPFWLNCFVLLGITTLASATDFPSEWSAELTLTDAVHRSKDGKSLELYGHLRREGGRWQGVVLLSGYNSSYHLGHVQRVEQQDDQITINLVADIMSDAWMPGTAGRWLVQLQRDANTGRWHGTHTGRIEGRSVSGNAVLHVDQPMQRQHAAAKPGERPRLLFRAKDIPRLRTKAATRFGQAAVQRLREQDNAVSQAMLYILTGDQDHADASWHHAQQIMAETVGGTKFTAHRVWAWRAEALALSMDWCYHAWSSAQRAEVAAWLARFANRAFYEHGAFTEYTGWYLTHKIGTQILAGGALAALAIRDEPGPADAEPSLYLGGHDPQQSLPNKGHPELPQSSLEAGEPLRHWWFRGPMDDQPSMIDLQDASKHFRPLPSDAWNKKRINVCTANGRVWHSENWLATVVVNDQRRWVQFDGDFANGIRDPKVWFGGVPIRQGDAFLLEPGHYTMLVRARLSEANAWGVIYLSPQLKQITAEAAATIIADRTEAAQARVQTWRQREESAQQNGVSSYHRRLFETGRGLMALFHRHAIGDGGFPTGEKVSPFMLQQAVRYPAAFRSSEGIPLTAAADMEAYLPRLSMAIILAEDGTEFAPPIDGNAAISNFEAWFENWNTSATAYSCLFPIVAPEYQASVLADWQRRLGIRPGENDAQAPESPINRQRHDIDWRPYDTHTAWAFITYPLDMPTTPLPAGSTSWLAEAAGWFGHRLFAEASGNTASDILAQVFAKHPRGTKWNRDNAGAIRLAGFGRRWIGGPRNYEQDRSTESVVVFPNQSGLANDAHGRIIVVHQDEHHSSVAIDLSATLQQRQSGALITGYGQQPLADSLQDQGYHHQRVVGMDTSGASGASVIMAVADRIEVPAGAEGLDGIWQIVFDAVTEKYGKWQVVDANSKKIDKHAWDRMRKTSQKYGGNLQAMAEAAGYQALYRRGKNISEHFEPESTLEITINDNRFIISDGTDVSLTGIVLSAEPAKLHDQLQEELRPILYGHHHQIIRTGVRALQVTGGQSYWVVMTLQRGPAPEISVVDNGAQGLDATVQVGDVLVSLDEMRIRFTSSSQSQSQP